MKKLLFLFTLTILFIGCKKDSDTEATPGPLPESNNPEFSADVNGILMNADTSIAELYIDTSLGFPMRIFSVFGRFGNYYIGSGFLDNLTTDLTVSSFNSQIAGLGALVNFIDINDTINEYNSINASFSITFADTIARKVSGNFSGTLVADVSGDTVVIANGKFKNFSYTKQ